MDLSTRKAYGGGIDEVYSIDEDGQIIQLRLLIDEKKSSPFSSWVLKGGAEKGGMPDLMLPVSFHTQVSFPK